MFWVGLDGFWSATIEQAGSQAYCATAGGTPSYSIWWEMVPTNFIQTVLTINAGDTIEASVTFQAPNDFVIKVTDKTSHDGFTEVELCPFALGPYTCARSSAEVIAEAPQFADGSVYPLADYGTMSFDQVKVTDFAGNAGGLLGKAWLNGTINETDGVTTYATVSPLFGDGKTFNATWQHS